MRILVFGLSSQFGGVESFIIDNCSIISAKDSEMEFEYLVIDSIPGYIPNSAIGPSTFHIAPNRVHHFFEYQKRLDQIIDEGNYDCVWYNTCTLSDVTLLKKAKKRVPRRIVHAHNSKNLGSYANHILHEIHKRKIRNLGTDFLACSHCAGAFMFPDFDPTLDSDFIYRNSIDVRKFQRDADSVNSAKATLGLSGIPVFLHVGRFHPQKNHAFTIDVMHGIKTALPNARLLLAGDGPMKREIIDLVKSKRLEDNVSFLGSRKDIPQLLAATDVFLLPSLYEGFPVSLLEAQAAGLQCLGSSNITEEAFLTDRSKRLSLESVDTWVNACLTSYENSRTHTDDCCQFIVNKGYDLGANSEAMHQFLLNKQPLQTCQVLKSQ